MEDDDRPLEYTAELWQLMPDDAKPLLREEVEMNREHAEKTMRWLRSATSADAYPQPRSSGGVYT